jgi:hypothetical protein
VALSANAAVKSVQPPSGNAVISAQVYKSSRIYAGGFVGKTPNGYAKPFEAGDEFWGVALEEFYNSSTTSGAVADLGTDGRRGQPTIKIMVSGHIYHTVSGVGDDDIGKAVYASDDNTLAMTGEAYGFVGRIVSKKATDEAIIKLKEPGEKTLDTDLGTLRMFENASHGFTATGAASATAYLPSGFAIQSILGLGVTYNSGAAPQIEGEFDAVAEAATAALYGLQSCAVSGGLRLRGRWVLTNAGDGAATILDVDFGLGTILTANSLTDLSHADMVDKIAFHIDGNNAADDDIKGWSENNNTEVTPVDTTINNDEANDTYKDFLIIVRTGGGGELWIDSGSGFVRVLDGVTGASTTLSVASGVGLAPFWLMEKASDDTVAVALLREIEFTGARTVAIG